HKALSHHARMGSRDRARWNIACDLSVNPVLLEAGFTLPKGRLVPGEGSYQDLPQGKSAEEDYALLGHSPEYGREDPPSGDDASPDPGRCGSVRPPGDGSLAACKQAAAEAQVAVAQARQVAQQRGALPGGLARLVEEVLQPKVDWREVLREFVSCQARTDYSWNPPSRRFLQQGLYLPSLRSEELGAIVLAVDISGSIR